MGRNTIKLSAILFFLVLLQPFLMETRRMGLPAVSSLHTLNAAFIGMTGGMVVAAGRRAAAEQSGEMAAAPVAAD